MPPGKKRPWLTATLWTLATLAGCCGLPGFLSHRLYMYEYYDVKERLEDIPGIRILDMWGNEDLHLEDIWAEIQVGERGRMKVFNLDKASFTGTKYLPVYEVGEWALDVCFEDELEWNWSNHITVAPDEVFASLFPFELRTVQDLVRHYDEIERVVAAMPRDPAPRELRVLPDGRRVMLGTKDARRRDWPLRTTECVEPAAGQR